MSWPFLRLLRLHQPAGILLLLWPCLWSLELIGHGRPPLATVMFFTLGALLMRASGCVINDLADRRFDAHVARTHTRPLASGALSRSTAVLMAVALLLGAAGVALQLGQHVLLWAAAIVPLVVAYPFMKRLTYWPQAFLGITFNWGVLLASVALENTLTLTAAFLYVAALFWTLGYDTIYAYQDAADDALLGLKSSALRLGSHPHPWIGGSYAICIFCLSVAGALEHAGLSYFLSVGAFGMVCMRQVVALRTDDSDHCMRLFKRNAWWGFLPALGATIAF